MEQKKTNRKINPKPDPKTATDNQWVTTHQKGKPDTRERHDGPGGN